MKISKLVKNILLGAVFVSAPLMAQDANKPSLDVPDTPIEKKGHWEDIVYGDPNAPIEIIEYASLTCSHCGDFARDVFPQLKEKYLDTGKVKLVFRNFFLNQMDLALTVVARCKDEKLAEKITHSFLTKQSSWMNAQQNGQQPITVLEAIATINGLPMGEFQTCLNNKPLADHLIKKREEYAKVEKVGRTPTIKMDGVELSPPTWFKLETAIEMKLNSLNK